MFEVGHLIFGIDLLIGADLFYEILRSVRRTRPGYPVLQETVLGWTLSGKTPVAAITTKNEPQHTFMLQEDNSPEHNPTHLRELDSVEQSSMSTRQPTCDQQVKTLTTQQQAGGCVVKPQPKEDHTQFFFFHLSTERKLQLMENRRIRQLKDNYYQLVKESKATTNN
jgi:hypothetical protein